MSSKTTDVSRASTPTAAPETDYWLTLADHLVEIAESLTTLAGKVPPAEAVTFQIQPGPWLGIDDAERVRIIDTIGQAVLGHGGHGRAMGDRTVHHDARGLVGDVAVGVFRALDRKATEAELRQVAS